ncbi:MAG: mandelate racemase/muconate lactonizing enzyme family protein [Acidiferrobacterales bacterium]|nr:mandelate racemase/muconate lactonizing enzyme family protein [Acidiferrobacterales bacterium]
MKLAQIVLHRLRVPLRVPYKLSLGEIKAFDTLLVETRTDDQRVGVGEATVLTGYTHETIDQAWTLAGRLGAKIAGQPLDAAKHIVAGTTKEAPFTATALTTAIEMLEGSPYLQLEQAHNVPLLALVHATAETDLATELDQLIKQGYRTLKVKIGFDADPDLERVRIIQRLVDGRASLRLDANQAYDVETACRFAASLDPKDIELLEQTCAAGDWQAARAVAQVSTVPLMLDESIYGVDDVDKAAELGAARYIKYKLMKAGSLAQLADALGHIRTCGMEPVLGNGVACDIGCWMEACVAATHITNAGEMNGFLKTQAAFLQPPLAVHGDAIKLDPANTPQLNETALARYRDASVSFPAS